MTPIEEGILKQRKVFVSRVLSQTGRTDLATHPKVLEAEQVEQADATRLIMEAIVANPTKAITPLPPLVLHAYQERLEEGAKRRKYELIERVKIRTAGVDSYLRYVDEAVEELVAARRELDSYTGVTRPDLSAELSKAQAWYELVPDRCTAGAIVLRTPTVFISHFNTKAGINETVRLGRYEVYIPLHLASITVLPCDDNVKVSGVYHPHISSIGQPCWGTGGATVRDALESGHLSTALEVLRSLLCTYNDAGPYQPINRFVEERQPEEWAGRPMAYHYYGWHVNSYVGKAYSKVVLIPHVLLPKDKKWAQYSSATRTFTIGGTPKKCKGYFVPVYDKVYEFNGMVPHSLANTFFVKLSDGSYHQLSREYNVASAPWRSYQLPEDEQPKPPTKEVTSEQEDEDLF